MALPVSVRRERFPGFCAFSIGLLTTDAAAYRWLVLCVFALWLSACSDGITAGVQGVVLSTSGAPQIRARDEQQAHQLTADTHPTAGDTIQTDANSWAAVALNPSVLAAVEPASKVQIVDLSLSKDGNETEDSMRGRAAHVKLISGSLILSQERSDVSVEPRLTLETPDGVVVSSFDCLFTVQADAAATRVTCASGYVYLEHPGAEADQVKPGSVRELPRAGRARTVAAELDPVGQATITRALESETEMRALRAKLVDVLPR